MEGEVIEFDDELDESQTTTKYQLTGIVVHSGQASGGHYFSYILHKYVKPIDSNRTLSEKTPPLPKKTASNSMRSRSHSSQGLRERQGSVVQVRRRRGDRMQNARGRRAEGAVLRRRLHGRGVRQQSEAHAIPQAEALVERVHAILYTL